MVNKNIQDDLLIMGENRSSVSYIKKPVEKTLELEGTVNIVSGGAGAHNIPKLLIDSVDVRQNVNGTIQEVTHNDGVIPALTGLNGIITTKSLITVANSEYAVDCTHDSIVVGDVVIATIQYAGDSSAVLNIKLIDTNILQFYIRNSGSQTFNAISKIHWTLYRSV